MGKVSSGPIHSWCIIERNSPGIDAVLNLLSGGHSDLPEAQLFLPQNMIPRCNLSNLIFFLEICFIYDIFLIMKVGNKIRHARKKLGINMKDFAKMVGISYLTLHRMETDQVSPSVALLSEISHHLGEPIVNFFSNPSKLTLVKKGTAPVISSGKMDLQLLLPKGVISDNISVSKVSSKAGEVVSDHSHNGFELTYILKGKATFNYDGVDYETAEGDLVYFDATVPHYVVADEPHEILSIYFRKK